jgi:4-hydroxy-tetrahydrodipicolinate synthase
MSKTIQGVLTAIVTPFDQQGEVSTRQLRQQVQRQIRYGNGIFCNGTNGEFFVLTAEEKLLVAEHCIDEVAGKVPVVAHIGEISTAATIRLGKKIAQAGIDAVSVITPYFVPLRQHELIAHYSAIADALTVPVYLYNIPARTGNTIEPATALALAAHPNIVGVKDSAGSYESLKGFLDATRDCAGFDVLSGPDHLAYQGFVDGCPACISGLANFSPEGVSLIWNHFRDGQLDKSRQAQEFIGNLRKDLYALGFAPAAVKKATQLLGEDVGESRYPVRFSDADLAAMRTIVHNYGVAPKY